uniref:J domain-containing protein n=1 Tax=Bracon brevicornis TaxID=1563983 RepID=A0A6V7J5K2_9HYME
MSAGRIQKKDHYQSLEIDEKATQREIKSAYFKLSMKYHPDKNSSEDAKVKFRDISEAYEVLGNYNKRRQYDRGMRIKTSSYSGEQRTEEVKPRDIEKEAYRARAAIYRSAETATMGKMYDFETWTKAHYGNSFRAAQNAKHRIKYKILEKEQMGNEFCPKKTSHDISILAGIICFVAVLITVTQNSDYDKPIVIENDAKDDSNKDSN